MYVCMYVKSVHINLYARKTLRICRSTSTIYGKQSALVYNALSGALLIKIIDLLQHPTARRRRAQVRRADNNMRTFTSKAMRIGAN